MKSGQDMMVYNPFPNLIKKCHECGSNKQKQESPFVLSETYLQSKKFPFKKSRPAFIPSEPV